MKVKKKLFYKIFFSYLIIIGLSFLILGFFVRDEVRKVMTSQIEAELLSYAQLIDQTSMEKASANLERVAQISRSRVTLIDAEGNVFADSEKEAVLKESHFNRPEVQEARLKGIGKSIRHSNSLKKDMIYTAVAVKDGQEIKGYVRLARPLQQVQSVIYKTYLYIPLTFSIVALIALVIALFFSYRLYEPIKIMEQFTEKLRLGGPVGSIVLNTSDETKTLADNINYLVEELREKINIANEERSKLMTAFTSMNEGVMMLDEQGYIEFISPVLSSMLEIQYNEVIGKTLLEAFRNLDLQNAFQEFKDKRTNVSREIVLGHADQVVLNVSLSAVSGRPDEEKVMIVFHDVTRLKNLEQVRMDFVANVTHEIKTPLTAIIGYLETIQAGAINNQEEVEKFVDIILKQSERLNRLVEDLLTISNIETKQTVLSFENICLKKAIDNILSLFEAKAEPKNLTLHNNVSDDFPPLTANKDRLMQIFVNILDNAVKFTPNGGEININASESDTYAIVTIQDTGIGVPKEDISRLGERFYRVDKSRSRELGGTGLGLSIVKHLMIAHGGKMKIESELGKGTTVSLYFPIQQKNSI